MTVLTSIVRLTMSSVKLILLRCKVTLDLQPGDFLVMKCESIECPLGVARDEAFFDIIIQSGGLILGLKEVEGKFPCDLIEYVMSQCLTAVCQSSSGISKGAEWCEWPLCIVEFMIDSINVLPGRESPAARWPRDEDAGDGAWADLAKW
eukprot:jgi/Botrbrau1/21431/Bobra.0216s0044.1